MSSSLPYYTMYPKDFDTDEHVRSMEDCELGMYLRMLNHAWVNDGLPVDAQALRKLFRYTQEDFEKRWMAVEKCFPETGDGRRRNPRQESERSKVIQSKEINSARGKKGAAARWNASSINQAMAPVYESGSVDESKVVSGESVERVQDSETAIAEFPTVRRIWERIIGKLKASERRMLEEKMADTPMPDDEWEERILAYKSSTWGTSNNYPLRGFLKDPQSWEVRNQPESTALVVSSSSAVRDAVAARPAVQALFYQFIKNGRELTEPEMADGIAAIAEFQLSDDNLNCSTGHAERNFPKWTHIPGPGNYLRKHKPWTTLKIDNPVPRQPVKMSIQDQVMERRYQKHPEERPRV